jgi:hypothetical protein
MSSVLDHHTPHFRSELCTDTQSFHRATTRPGRLKELSQQIEVVSDQVNTGGSTGLQGG